jgi:hypothetical protein
MKCGRVESNHHSLRRRGYSALGSPVPGIREKEGRPAGFEPTLRDSQSRVLADYTTVTTKRGRPDSNRRPLT